MFNNFSIESYILIPLLIFVARIFDVSIGTIRIIFISRGVKILAPILGFFEILIWLVAITKIMSNLDNVISYLFYAAGFAAGNYIGMVIEEKLSLGFISIKIFATNDSTNLIDYLKDNGYGITLIDATGKEGKVNIIYTIIERNKLKLITPIIEKYNPKSFYSIEEVKTVNKGIFPKNSKTKNNTFFRKLIPIRKAK